MARPLMITLRRAAVSKWVSLLSELALASLNDPSPDRRRRSHSIRFSDSSQIKRGLWNAMEG